ncbi:dTDP-glucose 4,6-dehydratase [bacterium]|jgi:dTDP-glucose 4,6-dehydratase|nr:dTDP-glucose 4,6-dehydratase [bacterium]MBT4649490.1 dTDP-glucose 4,6-dehydratase [bacterium]
MNLLVTGGAGFIGSNFIYYILDKYPEYKIINLDLLTYAGNLDNLKKLPKEANHKFVKGDINDYDLVSKIIQENDIDMIVHFAAESHVDRSIQDPDVFLKTNILGTSTLLRAAKENGNIRFHHISTDEVYGSLGKTGIFTEDTAYDPRSPYSASKAASDHLVRSYYHTFALPITISNCSNNYGPYQFPEKLIPLLVTNLLQDKKIPIYGKGENIRDWIHVSDHCRAIDLILHKGKIGETYCVGGENEMHNIDIAKMILQIMHKNEEMIEYVQDRLGHDYRYAISNKKINKELNWKPKIDFSTGLTNTVEWYKNNTNWWKKLK